MKISGLYCIAKIVIALTAALLITGACDDTNPVDSNTGEGDLREIRLVVLEYGRSDSPLPGVKMVIDNKSSLTCTTADPTGDCTFMLGTVRHTIVLSKTSYTTVYDTFDITSSMTVKYFAMFKSQL